jgi:Gas vesicle synthesis protein GvpL/GvpF
MSEMTATEEMAEPVYLYGVVRGELTGRLVDVAPIDGEGEVYGITRGGLTAAVSDAGRDRYEVSRRYLLGHEAVVTALMERHDVLPARFGGVCPRERMLADLLVGHRDTLLAQIDRIAGMVELDLVVRWADLQRVITEIVAGDPKLRAARRSLASGGVSRNVRLDVGKRVEHGLAALRAAEATAVSAALAPYAADRRSRPDDRDADTHVLNAAFLAGRGGVAAFERAVTEYDRAHPGRYEMRLGTPVAPYWFVTPLAAPGPVRPAVAGPAVTGRRRARR